MANNQIVGKISISFFFLCLITGILLCSAGCLGEKPTYTVGISPTLSPFSMTAFETGKAEGMDVDLLNAIGKDQGISFVYEFCNIGEYQKKLESGELDVGTAALVTPVRKEIFLFTDPYFSGGYGVVTRKNANVTLADVLAGTVSIACLQGSAYESWLKDHFGLEQFDRMVAEKQILLKYTQDAAVYAVLTNEVKTAIGTDTVLAEKLREYSPLVFLGYLTEKTDVGFVVRKGNTDLAEKINAGLARIRESGEYTKILEKYNLPQVKSEYRVGISANQPPFSYYDENHTLTGIDVESMRWIAERNGINITFVETSWSKGINAIVNGNLDLWYDGMRITKERLAKITFSKPYAPGYRINIASLPTHPVTKEQYESGEVSVGIVASTASGDWLIRSLDDVSYQKRLENGSILLYPTHTDLVAGLNRGEVDCVVLTELVFRAIGHEHPLRLVTSYKTEEDYGVAMQNGDIALQELINKGIDELTSSGKLAELMKNYQVD